MKPGRFCESHQQGTHDDSVSKLRQAGQADGFSRPHTHQRTADQVSSECPPVQALEIPRRTLGSSAEERRHIDLASPDKVRVGDHDSEDWAQKHTVGRQVRRERARGCEEVPRADGQSDGRAQNATAANGEVARHHGRQVRPSAERIGSYVGANLRNKEGDCNEEDTRASRRVRGRAVEELGEDVQRVPSLSAEDDRGRR